MAQCQVDSIEQSGAALGVSGQHTILKILNTVGEGAGEFGVCVEADYEECVGGIGGFEKLNGGVAGFGDFIGHAAAEIEDDADGNGDVFGRKGNYFLLGVVFKDAEIIRLESGDQAIVRIGYGDVDQSDVDIGVQHFAGLDFQRRSVEADVVLGIGVQRSFFDGAGVERLVGNRDCGLIFRGRRLRGKKGCGE